MIKIEEIQERLTTTPQRTDVKVCLRESNSVARGRDALLSINYLLLAIFGILKIKDLTKPEKTTFNDNISKILGSIDLIPLVKEATKDESSLISTFEEKGLKDIFARLQIITREIKKLERNALERKAIENKEAIDNAFIAISKELDKGNIAAAKSKSDRLLKKYPQKREKFLEKIIAIFEEKESLKGWWYYIQQRYKPEECTLEEAKYCAAKVAKIRSLDDPENTKNWYRNNLDYRLRVWELTPKDDLTKIDSTIEACYNLATCVYYVKDKIHDKVPKVYGRELIEEGLRIAPDSFHLKKMGKTFGIKA